MTMTNESPRRAPTAEERYFDIGAVKREGYPWLEDPSHPRWALQQAGWPSLTPEEARMLCELKGNP
jgi:hypothetical protein